MNRIAKAARTIIFLGDISLEVFMLPDGKYRLSQTQAAESIEKGEISFRRFLTSGSAEAVPYKEFRSDKISIEGNNIKINAVPISLAVAYWTKQAVSGNVLAARIRGACATESIECRADVAFNIQRTEEDRNERMAARIRGKQIRRRLTDAIAAYIERHSELSENDRKWLFVNASQRVILAVFGRKAAKLAEDLKTERDRLRDALTPEELLLLQEVEDTAVRLIDWRDIHPDEAIKQAAERLLIPVQRRALS